MSGLTTTHPDALQFVENPDPAALEAILADGNLARLTTPQRLQFVAATCRSLKLNPLTRPFEFINLQGKLVMYARKDCTDQLRKRDRVSITNVRTEVHEGVMTVTVTASLPDGRQDSDIGAVYIGGLKNDALAVSCMKAITKAKRRVTLSICGLGFLDESEVEDAQRADLQNEPEQPVSAVARLAAYNKSNAKVHDVVADDERPKDPPPEQDNELLDMCTAIADAKDCESLARTVDDSNTMSAGPKQATVKRAIKARADALGISWDKTKGCFVNPELA